MQQSNIEMEGFVNANLRKSKRIYEFLKRFIDISASISGLIIIIPILVIVAIAIKIESKEPVFFHKRELDLMDKHLGCTNLDLW